MSDVEVTGLCRAFGDIEAVSDVDISLGAGEVVVLLGPSGCGKTTLLRMIAGLVRPDRGEITLGGRRLDGPDVHVVPEDRSVGLVFQNGVLFPHLSVARNIGFGLQRSERKSSPRIDELLELVGLTDAGDRMPDTLSGGQSQRVALARALAPGPSVLLMDEPFSNLDAVLRTRLRREISDVLSRTDTTTLFVTHDREEAFAMGHRVAIMAEGRIRQVGTPEQVYRQPVDPWVSGFVGESNLIGGIVSGGAFECELGSFPTNSPDGPARILFRPEDLRIAAEDEASSPASMSPNARLGASVVSSEYVGTTTLLCLATAVGELLVLELGETGYSVGDRVFIAAAPDCRSTVFAGHS